LRNARRKLVEHRALCLAEGAERAADLFLILDVDGVAGDAVLAERQVVDPEGAALSVDRDRDDALDRQVPVGCLGGDLPCRQSVDRLDQFGRGCHHCIGIVAPYRRDIGRVDKLQRAVGSAEPHRHRRGLDQRDQRGEVPAGAGGLFSDGFMQ